MQGCLCPHDRSKAGRTSKALFNSAPFALLVAQVSDCDFASLEQVLETHLDGQDRCNICIDDH